MTSTEDTGPSYKETLEIPIELAETAVKPNSMKELIDRMVVDMESIVAEQHAMPSGQLSSSTADLDFGEGPLAEEPKSSGFNAADMLNE